MDYKDIVKERCVLDEHCSSGYCHLNDEKYGAIFTFKDKLIKKFILLY